MLRCAHVHIPRLIFRMGLGTRLVATHYAVVLETEVQPCQVPLHVTGHHLDIMTCGSGGCSPWCLRCLQCLRYLWHSDTWSVPDVCTVVPGVSEVSAVPEVS